MIFGNVFAPNNASLSYTKKTRCITNTFFFATYKTWSPVLTPCCIKKINSRSENYVHIYVSQFLEKIVRMIQRMEIAIAEDRTSLSNKNA